MPPKSDRTPWVPAAEWVRSYRPDWLRPDLLAGLTCAAVVIPQAMAYATIVGLPVQVGLYTALVPLLVYSLLGTSRALSVSTTSTIAALTAVAIESVSPQDATEAVRAVATLVVLTGTILLLAGVLKLGFLAEFISAPVLAGFKAGTGLLIISGQLGKVLGIEQTGANFFSKTWSALTQLGQAHALTALVAGATIAVLLAAKRWAPQSFPGALVVVVTGIALSAALDLKADGLAVVGPIPSGLPGPQLPDPGLIDELLPAAAGIALMSFVESIAAARAFVRVGERGVDADHELVALGAANVGGGVFQSLPAGGGLSQTAVNDAGGARTPLAGATTAAVTLITLLFLTGLFEALPQATLGAVVIVAAAGLVDIDALRSLGRIRGTAVVLGSVTLLGVLALGVLKGVLIGVIASLGALVAALNRPVIEVLGRRPGRDSWRDLTQYPDGEMEPGTLVTRIGGPVYFANVTRVHSLLVESVDEAPEPPRVLVVDLVAVTDTDVSTLLRLPAIDRDLRERGVTLRLANPSDQLVRLLQRAPDPTGLSERLFAGINDAVGGRRN
jgi:high affinity sulfate transporter 1